MTTSRQNNKSPDNHPDFLNIQEAAKALNITIEALRKRITRGTIESIKENGHWYVHIVNNGQDNVQTGPDNVQTGPDNVQIGPDSVRTDTQGQIDGAELAFAAMEARIASLETQLASKDGQLGVAATQIGELHRLLAQTALNAAERKPWWKIWR